MPSLGVACCLASAAAFGAMGIFGKLAYDEGATVGTLLATRFTLAALVLWIVVACTRRAPRPTAVPRRDLLLGLAIGAIGYGAQAGGYFSALARLDASLLSLLVYSFPVMVTVAAVALGREKANARSVAALTLASAGLVLVLAGAAGGALDPLGTALALGTAFVYSAYVLVSEGIAARLGPLIGGDLAPGRVSAEGYAWLAGLALVSTVAAIGLFFAGLRRTGQSAAAILSTLEPVVTVGLAYVAFGESLGPAQLAGGALVLLAAAAVRAPKRPPRRRPRLVLPPQRTLGKETA